MTVVVGIVIVSSNFAAAQERAVVRRSRHGGEVTMVKFAGRNPATPAALLREHGTWFGVVDSDRQLREARSFVDDVRGHRHTRFEQIHQGIPVFASELILHQDDRGRFLSLNGRFRKIPEALNVIPHILADDAIAVARREMTELTIVASPPRLVIVDPGWYGDPPRGARLAWEVHLSDGGSGRAHAYFIDAASGEILDEWSLIHDAKFRRVFDGGGGSDLGTLARSEGDEPVVSPVDVNTAYDYSGDVYGYLFRAFNHDSVDGDGHDLVSLVNSTAPDCPNAFWSPIFEQTVFCTGLVTDDIVAHEFTHAVTQFSANLIYQNQSGQLNEAFSDIFGELVDLFNGDGSSTGPPGGLPWPDEHLTGQGTDQPNNERTNVCTNGVAVRVNTPGDIAGHYVARAVGNLGPRLNTIGVTGDIVWALPRTACPAGRNLDNAAQVAGKIAVIDEGGGCTVVAKAHNAQNAGAIGIIIAATGVGTPPSLSGTDNRIGIPLVTIAFDDASMLEAALLAGPVNVTMKANPPRDSVRWLMGEDASGGAIRDMWNPRCFFNPESANSVFNTCGESDNGGVHSGSGVPNHAFALAVDGGEFGGFNIDGVGAIKAGAVWFRALSVYLTPASDFEDAYAALVQSADDLVGTFPLDPRTGFPSSDMFTSLDAESIDRALRAVELDTPGRCGGSDEVLTSANPPICEGSATIFSDDFETGAPGWSVSNSAPFTPYDWVMADAPLPFDRAGRAWFFDNSILGDCVNSEKGVHSLSSPPISIPPGAIAPRVAFTHLMESEGGVDGGNVTVCVVGGGCRLVPRSAFQFNPYNGRLITAAQGSTNPRAGDPAWTGAGGRWGASIFRLQGLAQPGDTITLRFDFAKDDCGGVRGWYVDDVRVYDCPDCDADGLADQDETHFAAASEILSNIGVDFPQNLLIRSAPQARGDVTLQFTVHGDFRNVAEFADVDINGVAVGTVFVNHASDCNATPDEESLVVPVEVFNKALGTSNARITVTPSAEVGSAVSLCGGASYVTIFAKYDAISSDDANDNGRLDACEGDVDGDGDVDLDDAAVFMACFTGPDIPVSGNCLPADLDLSGHVDDADLARLVSSMSGPR